MPSETIPALREALAKAISTARAATSRAAVLFYISSTPAETLAKARAEEAAAWAAVDQAVEALAGPDAGEFDDFANLLRVNHWLYEYVDPMSGKPYWRRDNDFWNGQQPMRAIPLYGREDLQAAFLAGFSAASTPQPRTTGDLLDRAEAAYEQVKVSTTKRGAFDIGWAAGWEACVDSSIPQPEPAAGRWLPFQPDDLSGYKAPGGADYIIELAFSDASERDAVFDWIEARSTPPSAASPSPPGLEGVENPEATHGL